MVDLSLYRFSHPITVRFADIDAMQHVNNACHFTYMETARVYYTRHVMQWQGSWENLGIIIAHARLDYVQPIRFDDRVRVHMRTSRLGIKSFDFEYAITCGNYADAQAEPVTAATGMTVQVAYDYARKESIPLPADWREKIAAFEPGLTP